MRAVTSQLAPFWADQLLIGVLIIYRSSLLERGAPT